MLFRSGVRLGGFDAVAQLVAEGVGVAVMSESAAARFAKSGTQILGLSDAWSRRKLLVCMTPAGSELPSVSALANALLTARPQVGNR